MKSLILKTAALALAATFVIATAGFDTAEAKRGGGHGGGHGFRSHGGGHGHGHHFRHRHFHHAPIFFSSGCYWKHGRKICS